MMDDYNELVIDSMEKFEREIFALLQSNVLLKRNTGFISHSFPKIIHRLELQTESVQSRVSLLHEHLDAGGNLENFDKSVLQDLMFGMVQTMLCYFRIVHSGILGCIDLSKINILTDNSNFLHVVKALSEFKNDGNLLIFHFDGLQKFFNINLFNALEKDLWWINGNFECTFEESDENIISFNIGEMYENLATVNGIAISFVKNYLRIYDGALCENLQKSCPHTFI